MPARRQKQTNDSSYQPPPSNRVPTEEENLAQLQRAVEQQDDASNAVNNNDNAARSGPATPATDGARRPVAAGADYSSLRLLTRRQPADLEAVLHGVDTSALDLSWNAKEGPESLDPNGQPWKYPKKRGKGEGSNLDQFKDDITERTNNGQGCKAIAEAYIEMGVDTSVRAVARQRMKWGLRQRAKRKMTEQGIANIRKAHLEQAKRMANSDPMPVKRVRIRVMRKAEITRMTKEGMSAAQIAENLARRGVKLSRGAATVERLRTVWGLTEDNQRSINNIRATARNQATRSQKEQFENIAKELGMQDVDAWVKAKMEEECAQDARREYAFRLMGNARPKYQSPEVIKRNRENLKAALAEKRAEVQNRGNILTKMPGVDYIPQSYNADFSPSQQLQDSASTPAEGSVTAGPSAPNEVIELSDDDDDSEDEDMDGLDGDGADTVNAAENGEDGETANVEDDGVIDLAAGDDHQDAPQVSREATQQPSPAMDMDTPAPVQAHASAPPQASNATGIENVYMLGSGLPAPASEPAPAPPQVLNITGDPSFNNVVFFRQFKDHSGPRLNPQEFVTAAPPAGMPGRPPAMPFAKIAPRPVSIAPRSINLQPCAPQKPPYAPTALEIKEMAEFGLTPYPCPGKPPQRYLTPKGMITCNGYEYLASPPPPPLPGYGAHGGYYPPQPPPQLHNGEGQSQPVQTWSVVPIIPPPEARPSQIPQPMVVIPPEEIQKHSVEARVLEGYQKVSQDCLDMLAARASGRPMPFSLTGLPPSLKDVQLAKEKLREAAQAILVEL